MSSIIEYLRQESVDNLFKRSRSVQSCWVIWQQEINRIIGTTPEATDIINLGDRLSDVFQKTRSQGRSQASLSGGGAAWEGLVCWYLNLCLIGSRVVVIKQHKTLVPDHIANAISVRYGNFSSNTESDLIAITFPDNEIYSLDKNTLEVNDSNGNVIPNYRNGKFNYKKIINRLVDMHFNDYGVGIIQCKTNWNDNAQIPMLWDMVYSSNGFADRNITVGTSTYSITNLSDFSYSFVTVPTSRGEFKPESTCVRRVHNISGGNYWGKPSRSAVADSIKEIFAKNFSHGASDLRTTLGNVLGRLDTDFSYFRLK